MDNSKYSFIVRIRSGGRVTIPEPIREALELEDGDIVELKFLRVVKKGSVPSEAPEMTGHKRDQEVVLKNE